MKLDIIPGTRISLLVPQDKTSDMDDLSEFLSLPSIVESLDEKFVYIQAPTYHGSLYPLPLSQLLMRFNIDSIPYSIKVAFENRLKRENILLAKMRRAGPIEKHQLREHFRMECSLHALIAFPDRGINEETGKTHISECRILDISEGGARIALNDEISDSENVVVSFDIGTVESIVGVVARSFKAENGNFKYNAGVKFNYTSTSQSNRIYKFIIQLQRKQMKNAR